MNILSLFDGMSCAQIALNKSGIKYKNYFASELDKYAIKVTQANYPNTKQLGDVRFVTGQQFKAIGGIDLLIGGSPCQGFSFAGKQLNFKDPRSELFFEYVRILRELKPRYFILENVKMKKEYQDIISDYLGVEPIKINSTLVSAQNRRRLYWSNIEGIEQPEDKGVLWNDIAQTQGTAVAAMRGRYLINGKRQDAKQKTKNFTKQYIEFRYDGKTNTITTVNKDNVVVPFTLENRILASDFCFRYLTPTECERAQTVPDNYTNHVSNTQRYKMLGNGFTVDIICHLLSYIKKKILTL